MLSQCCVTASTHPTPLIRSCCNFTAPSAAAIVECRTFASPGRLSPFLTVTLTRGGCPRSCAFSGVMCPRVGVVAQWYGVGLVIKRSRVRSRSGRGYVTTLGKLFTPVCLDADFVTRVANRIPLPLFFRGQMSGRDRRGGGVVRRPAELRLPRYSGYRWLRRPPVNCWSPIAARWRHAELPRQPSLMLVAQRRSENTYRRVCMLLRGTVDGWNACLDV